MTTREVTLTPDQIRILIASLKMTFDYCDEDDYENEGTSREELREVYNLLSSV